MFVYARACMFVCAHVRIQLLNEADNPCAFNSLWQMTRPSAVVSKFKVIYQRQAPSTHPPLLPPPPHRSWDKTRRAAVVNMAVRWWTWKRWGKKRESSNGGSVICLQLFLAANASIHLAGSGIAKCQNPRQGRPPNIFWPKSLACSYANVGKANRGCGTHEWKLVLTQSDGNFRWHSWEHLQVR